MKTKTVSLGIQYSVIIGHDLIANLGSILRKVSDAKTIFIVSDDTVDTLYGCALESTLKSGGYTVHRSTFPHGEKSKNIFQLSEILEQMSELDIKRNDLVITFGGGVTGDLGGLAAALYMRGIAYVQVPTTLLSAVDASVGGKTAINLRNGKNMAGVFWQPKLVLCDCDIIGSLPNEIFCNGMSEVIKHGVIKDSLLLDMIEKNDVREVLLDVIEMNVKIKSAFVTNDEFDRGERQKLNFGHTFGHAIEKASNFTISHGHAVGIGMIFEAKLGEYLHLSDDRISSRIVTLLRKYSIFTRFEYNAKELIQFMRSDKKNDSNKITFIIPRKYGNCTIEKVDINTIERFVEKWQILEKNL